ncbi:PREDICTED: CCAAT/enhancer-binding protein delta [Crocodylus porosus]|uniref:CCAAT/enhancer-binding protein delta n=1 Tax=Crocodylus porosus TaxID=8502 RepID=UPI00093FE65C|nr:PREDICTED: CCAAT/enhancer-binding protein delta [Crocodylus porosus]
MSAAAALHSLEPATCYRHWALEPATLYDAKAGSGGGCKGGRAMSAEEAAGGGSSCSLAELSAAAPAMYEDESAIDFSSYIDSMAAVPNLELCNDELFADLFNSNHKPERGADYADYLPPPPPGPGKELGGAMASLLGCPGPGSGGAGAAARGALKHEPDWSDSDVSSSLLPSQIALCAQTSMNLGGQPTPPTSPEPAGSCSPASAGTPGPAGGGRERAGKKSLDRLSPEYRQRRERNNIAVRKSRDKAKRRNQEMQHKLLELSAENERLHKKIEQLTRDLGSLRHFFKQLPPASFLQPGAGSDCR